MCPGVNQVSSKVIPTVSRAIPTNPGFRGWDLGGAWIVNLTYTYAHWYEPSYVIREANQVKLVASLPLLATWRLSKVPSHWPLICLQLNTHPWKPLTCTNFP